MKKASYWIEKYNLLDHPEGGYYAETYRSIGLIPQKALTGDFGGDRAYATGIYFLLENHHFSAFHRIKSDEMWHFYQGEALDIFVIYPESGRLEVIKLGDNPDGGETFQAVVPANTWFASRPASGSNYALVGCTVSPGFDFEDFDMADRETLQASFPQHAKLIEELTRI